ncbi:hypothetical protein [Aureimonas leprariae]|nr:hypothetical protein [Aureimonas leprariae]
MPTLFPSGGFRRPAIRELRRQWKPAFAAWNRRDPHFRQQLE